MKDSKRHPTGGFAPVYYSYKCVNCKQEFQGDKRSVQCEPCAIEMIQEESKTLYPINNTGSMFMPNKEEVKNIYRQEGFIEGAKHRAKQMYRGEDIINNKIK